MRILFLSNVFPSPVEPAKGVFNLGLVRACADLGHEMSVVAPIAWTDWLRASRDRRNQARQGHRFVATVPAHYPIFYYPPKFFRAKYADFMWRSIRASVRATVAEHRPQVVLSYWAHPDGECANRAAQAAGIPSVLITGGSDVLLLTAQPRRRQVIYAALKRADLILTVSEDLKCNILAGGIEAQKVRVVRRGIDTSIFHSGNRTAARQRLGLSNERMLLLWVGRMEPVKGLPILVEAIDALTNQGLEFDTILVGKGSAQAAVTAEIQRRDLQSKINLVGSVSHTQLADYYRAANIMVLPSLSEGVPNVLLESLACGTRFVASQVGGISEIASPGLDRLVPPGDAPALAAAIRAKLLNPPPDERPQFSPSDWPTAAARLIDVIEPLISDSPTRQCSGILCPPTA